MEELAIQNGIIPASLRDRPILQTFDADVWNAFSRLSARRNVSGFGAIGAIPYVEIASYLDIVLNLDDEEDRSLFIELVEYLDNLFLKDYAEKQRKEQDSKKPSKPKIILPT